MSEPEVLHLDRDPTDFPVGSHVWLVDFDFPPSGFLGWLWWALRTPVLTEKKLLVTPRRRIVKKHLVAMTTMTVTVQ